MEGYLGETELTTLDGTPFEGFGPQEWSLAFIERYGGCDLASRKAWVLDQVVRVLKGTPVLVFLAQWANGEQEYRFRTGEPTPAYFAWVLEMKGEYDEASEEYEYGYDTGKAP